MSKKNYSFKLRNVNLRFLVSIIILCIALIYSTSQLINQFIKYKYTVDLFSNVSQTAIKLQEGSDYLTEESRFFVLTTDYTHLQNYFYERNENKRRELAINELESLNPVDSVLYKLNEALEQSHNLENLELYSMALVINAKHMDQNPDYEIPAEILAIELTEEDLKLTDEYKIAKAWLLMFSEEYMVQKHQISDLKEDAINQIFEYTEETHLNRYKRLKELFVNMIVIVVLILLSTILLFICIITLVIIPLNNNIHNIKAGDRLSNSKTQEFNILTNTYNEMFDKNEANEILLRHKAEHDELTKLLNRNAYNQILYALKNAPIALILIDVDFFKQVNDKYGHPVGDKSLQKVAAVLLENFRANDYVARIGGDEFAVIMTDFVDSNAIAHTISSKMAQIKKSLGVSSEEMPAITLSCGIAISIEGYSENVYEQADKALYDVKREGRNNFKFYSYS